MGIGDNPIFEDKNKLHPIMTIEAPKQLDNLDMSHLSIANIPSEFLPKIEEVTDLGGLD